MAIRAEENALRGLLTDLVDEPGDAAPGQTEGLLLGIKVVELKRRDTAVVAAELTLPAVLVDEDLFHLSTAPCNCLSPAPFAAGRSASKDHEGRRPVPPAFQCRLAGAAQ